MSLKDRAANLEIEPVSNTGDKPGKEQKSGTIARAQRPAKSAEASLVLPQLDEKAADVLERGMKAQSKMWDVNAKCWVYFDDIRAQLEAVKLFYAYKFGMPVQRQIKIEANFKDNEEQILALVQSSPEAKRELIRAGVISEDWIETKAKKIK